MAVSVAMEPVSAGSAAATNYRYRPAMGERPMLADSTPRSPAGSRADDRKPLPFEPREQAVADNAEPERSRTADFAAAVIAGALAPTPQSMEELFRRIGASEIPEESQARLKDLLA
jgi:hypothetical protein